MYKVKDFIRWALTHVKPATIPSGAVLALPREQCGADPWHYLFGSHGHKTTRDFIEYRWREHYINRMSRAQYEAYTAGWQPTDTATDCQGLLDAWLTHVIGEATDINADLNYRSWCTEKGLISEISRPFVIGEAVFEVNGAGRMTHIGWICGSMPNGDPLIVEARGIAYGVVVTRLSGRNFTHRGLMTAKFDYNEHTENTEVNMIKFDEIASPMIYGDAYLAMQHTLNLAGYRDYDGRELEEDGKWGKRSVSAFEALLAAHTAPIETEQPAEGSAPIPEFVLPLGEYTAMYYRTEDLPEG